MTILYTKKGDKGKSIVGNNNISKDNPVMETLGELDELNSLCGFVKSMTKTQDTKSILRKTQEDLFIIQAIVAQKLISNRKSSPLQFGKEKTEELEKIIDKLGKKIGSITTFTIPGSNIESAHLDYLRAVTRRIERRIIKVSKTKANGNKKSLLELNPYIFSYLNRLSSLFFTLARYSAKKKNIKEEHPKYK